MSVRRSRAKAAKKKRSSKRFSPGVIGAGVAALAAVPAANAATFNVTNLNDNGAGSLRQAIVDANTAAGADVVTFQSGLTGTITLTTGQLYITDSVDIQGPGPSVLSVSGNNSSRVFYMYDSGATIDVRIAGLTITQGNASIGAGVVDFDENLVLDDVVITLNNSTSDGAGLWADGFNMNLSILNSTISGNISGDDGGGIYVEDTGGPLLIQDSVISGNQAADSGGGIYLYDPDNDVTISSTTISGNTAACCGGGVYLYSFDSGGMTIEDSTISGNSASFGGGVSLYSIDQGASVIRNTTISGNEATTAAGGIYLYALYGTSLNLNFVTLTNNSGVEGGGGMLVTTGSPLISNSIVADNTAPLYADLGSGDGIDLAYTLLETSAGANYNDLGGNLFNVDPQLAALANNGGPTETQRPALTSPVVNAADPAFAPPPATDQRGQPRVYPTRADMGALELVGGVIQFNPTTYNVTESAPGSVTLTVTRDVGPDPATVDFTTNPGTATAGAGNDFTTTSGTLTFATGDLSETFSVPILDDATNEGNEQFTATLSNPSGDATIGAGGTATVTILDDPAGTAQFSAATANTAEGAGTVTLSVTRTGGTEGALAANYTTADGTAAAPSDYTTTAGTVTFPAGDATPQPINVPIIDDTAAEGSEDFTVTLTGASIGAPATSTVTILDDPTGTAQFSASTASTAEGAGTVTLSVTRTGGSEGALAANYTTADGTAAAPSDYTTTAGTVTFPAGDTTPQPINVPIIDDTAVEGSEDFTVTLTGASIGAPATSTVTILDDPTGTAQFSASTASTAEGAGTVTLSVTRTGGSEGALAANYTTADGTAAAPSDYTTTAGTVTFPAGDTTPQPINVPIIDDTAVEGSEDFTVTLTGAAIGSPGSSTVTILDDPAGTAQFSVSTINTTEDGGTVTVTVTRTGGTEGPLVVNYATADGTAVAPADYTPAAGTITFPAGDATPQSFTISIINDNLSEGEEMFNVNLTGAAAGAPSSVSIVIAANLHVPPIPTVSFFGKLLLAMFSAMAGLYALMRSRISAILFAVLILGVAAGPTLSAAPKNVKESKGSKLRGTLVSVTNDGTTMVLTLSGGVSISLPTKSVDVVDARKAKRQAGTLQQVVQGTRVVIKTETDANGAIVKAKIKLTTE